MNVYTFRIPQPEARRIEVELQVEARGAEALDVRLPVWTPGSYLVREHQRHVDGLRAQAEGRELAVEKVDKQTWRVRPQGARSVRVSYRLHCFELTVRTNHVDSTHAFLNPSAAAVYVVGREQEACSVRVQTPPGWRTWAALPFEDGAYKAQDYDELADSPFECGPESSHASQVFNAHGVQHELVVWGKGDIDLRRTIADVAKIIDAEAAIFGGLPYQDRYLFILHLNDKGRGGLEHRRSCALIVPRFSFGQRSAYEAFLLLVAHEFFHLWNVKRLRPAAFTPYDWTRENHTRLLWAMEGLTSAYEVLALRRAGLVTPQRFLEIWAERITQLRRSPGLRTLDNLVQMLFERHGLPPGLPEDGVERAAIEMIGDRSLHEWFQRAIDSTQELQVDEALAGVGLKAVIAPAKSGEDKGGATHDQDGAPDAETRSRGWLGVSLKEKGGSLEVSSVAEGSPAQQAGLAGGDEIVAADGFRSDLKQRLGREQPVQLVAAPRDTVTFVPDPDATAEQVAARERWLGARWPEE